MTEEEVMCGSETVGDDEFGDMETSEGSGEGQELSSPVVCALDVSLQAAQFTQEQSAFIEAEVHRRIGQNVAVSQRQEVNYRIPDHQSCFCHGTLYVSCPRPGSVGSVSSRWVGGSWWI